MHLSDVDYTSLKCIYVIYCTNSHFPDPELQRRLNNRSASVVEKTSSVFVSIPEHGYGTRLVSVLLHYLKSQVKTKKQKV